MARTKRSSVDPKTSPIRQVEEACVKLMQQRIRAANVQDWADFFASEEVNQREQLIFGFQSGRAVRGEWHPELERFTLNERSTFELQAEVFDLHNHGKALALIEFVFYEVLAFYQPFKELEPLEPETYGNPTYDDDGKWIYSATFTTVRDPLDRTLTPNVKPPVIDGPLMIKIGLYNDRASPPSDLVEANIAAHLPTDAHKSESVPIG